LGVGRWVVVIGIQDGSRPGIVDLAILHMVDCSIS